MDLQVVQEQIERATFELTKSRAKANQEKADKRGAWAESKAGIKIVSELSASFIPTVQEVITPPKGAGRHNVARKLLMECSIEAPVLAFLCTKAVLNLFGSGKSGKIRQATVCRRIGDIIHDEWRLRYFREDKNRRAVLKKLLKDFDKRTYPRYWRKKTIKNYFDAHMISWEGWTVKEKIMVGLVMMKALADTTGLLHVNEGYVEIDEALFKRIKGYDAFQLLSFTLYKPMVVPPVKWADDQMFRGGYLNPNIAGRYPLIKRTRKKDVKWIVENDWSRVLPAINAIQETPWRVNSKMVEALDWAFNTYGGNIGSIPPADPRPKPVVPHDFETNEQAKKEHNRKAFEIHDLNRRDKSKRIATIMTLSIAKEYRKYQAIYFPHNFDTRGRAYPVTAFLSPQGPDYSKSLLEFSRGMRIGTEDGACWLAIATANAYGYDKASLQERVDWVSDNEEMILSIANDYTTDHRWMQAAEPFQFLRMCFEWKGYCEHGLDYVSHVPVPVDATNSGLQHYSAMLRDEVGGRSVNLVPGLSRQDIYGDVAARVIDKLMNDGSELASHIISIGIDRKITKRQVMVVPYAGKFMSCLGYTREAVQEKFLSGVLRPWPIEDENAHITMLAKMIWDSIDEVVVKAKEAMKWISSCASAWSREMNKTEKPLDERAMTWLTPDGFRIIHLRENEKQKRIDTILDGRVQIAYYEGTGRLDPKDMALAVAPNFVHSMDATHLRMTIIKAQGLGITDFAMVHDSFGVHAGLMPTFLKDAVKESFIEMYENNDVLNSFYKEVSTVVEVPLPPEPGSLDLHGIRESEFFFS